MNRQEVIMFMKNVWGGDMRPDWEAISPHLCTIVVEFSKEPLTDFLVGDRVRVKQTAGFHRGACGEVVFVEPNGEKIWVLRDGASSPVFYWNDELEYECTQ